MRDRTMRLLSLLFSVYSPLYPFYAITLRTLVRMDKLLMGAFILVPLIVYALVGRTGFAVYLVLCLIYLGLQTLWVRFAKEYSIGHGITVYPIHPILRRRISRLVAYTPDGTQLYEVHIDPKLTKNMNNPTRVGMTVVHAARILTSQLSQKDWSTSVIGTTYVPELAQIATRSAKKYIRATTRRSVCPIGSKWLFPKRQWDTFIWEI